MENRKNIHNGWKINPYIQATQQTQDKNMKKNAKHIIITLLKNSDKDKSKRQPLEKRYLTHQRDKIRWWKMSHRKQFKLKDGILCLMYWNKKETVNQDFYTQWNYPSKPRQNKDILRYTKTERNHHHQANTTRNVDARSSGRRKMIPDRNLDLNKGI